MEEHAVQEVKSKEEEFVLWLKQELEYAQNSQSFRQAQKLIFNIFTGVEQYYRESVPAVPKVVAEFIEECKVKELDVAVSFLYTTVEVKEFLRSEGEVSLYKYIDAYRYSYTIKEENFYVVKTASGTYVVLDTVGRNWDFEDDIEHATEFKNKEEAEAVAKLVDGQVWKRERQE